QTVSEARVPFCSLPSRTRELVSAGYREDRSPDLFAVTSTPSVAGGTAFRPGGPAPHWPSVRPGSTGEVPLIFWGAGVARGHLPSSASLDGVAPTLAHILDLSRPHPEVRSGRRLLARDGGPRPRLVLVVVWKGRSLADIAARKGTLPVVYRLMRLGASGAAGAGSLPLDPAAVMTTIGTGGLPAQHGVTGTLLRNDAGRLVRAWAPASPPSVIAALGDDLDRASGGRSRLGVVGTSVGDRGLIGKDWYLGGDRDRAIEARNATTRAIGEVRRGYGRDRVPDLLAVADAGPLPTLDRALGKLLAAARRASRGALTVVVTATGATTRVSDGTTGSDIAAEVDRRVRADDVIEAVAPGGLFLDEMALARKGVDDDAIARALRAMDDPSARPLFADVFTSAAIRFGRFC
ncbi:MAG TPA: hypothetical protein VE712_05540, partial [Actinomycetota bacterium]|nr:hypothetical protein [Actinomycetota bacterium]